MDSTALTIIVTYKTLPGKAEAFFKAVTESGVAAGVRQEPGNLGYNFYLPLEEEDTLVLIEKWASSEAADAHPFTDNVKKLASFKPDYVLETKAVRYRLFA
ncbi:MAG: hypothetical protein E7426_09250 [Ruminococcaceae bacterium]|jgi:quinol monooxygenase YgiN|nr:hypothetical protein [Oscillospiraceae bacterium]